MQIKNINTWKIRKEQLLYSNYTHVESNFLEMNKKVHQDSIVHIIFLIHNGKVIACGNDVDNEAIKSVN
jgi:hypothetical protein